MARLLVIAATILLVVLSWRLIASGGSGGFAPPASSMTVSQLAAAPEGGGVWFGAPRGIRNGDTTIVGYQTGGGDVKARIIDNDTRATLSTSTLYDNFIVDDHSPPSFVVRPDGVILAAFAYHVGDLYVGIGPSAGVLPAQANVTNITAQVGTPPSGAGYTYGSILYLDDEATYYLFFRYHDAAGQGWMGYSTSTDGGVTWSARTLVMPITYHKVVKNGTGRLDFVLSDHPLYGQGDNPAVKTSIYHMFYDGAWRGSDGTGLGTLPLGNTDGTLVFDGSTTRAWLWDIAIDYSGGGPIGDPVTAFVTYADPFPDGAWAYWDGRWDGSAWSTHEIADAGTTITVGATPETGEDYAGGIAIDSENPSRMVYSSDTSGAFQMYLAETTDDGATYSAEAITDDSAKHVRPFAIAGHDGRLSFGWWPGTYTDYFNWSQGIVGAGE